MFNAHLKSFIRACSVNLARKNIVKEGPGLDHFLKESNKSRLPKIYPNIHTTETYLTADDLKGNGKKVYGCQMNTNDMEIVRALLFSHNNYVETLNLKEADVVLLMTCSIREGAEDKIWKELKHIQKGSTKKKIVGVLGCMAERIKHTILEKSKMVDIVAGPDSYRDLSRLLAVTNYGENAINVQLSLDETYGDIQPVRENPQTKQAYVSIMRGCENMCTYCVVPLTRGKERSRPIDSILEEIRILSDQGFKQVTLLGQNVNSYRDKSESTISMIHATSTVTGFKTVYKPKSGGRTFDVLLDKVSEIDKDMRIRFTSPHPKDFPMEVIQLIKERNNICNQIHLPAQSGDNKTLDAMGRGYTVETYLNLVDQFKKEIPNIALTSDFISGFCSESEEGHQKTIDLIQKVGYSFCFVFPYSMREKTKAHYRLIDNVPEDVKRRRHQELKATFREQSLKFNQNLIGTEQVLLIETLSTKRSETAIGGRTDNGVKTIFEPGTNNYAVGDYVKTIITSATSQTLQAKIL